MDDFGHNQDEDQQSSRPGAPVDPRRLLRLVLSKWRAIGVGALLGAVIGTVVLSALPNAYVSSARLTHTGIEALGDTAGGHASVFVEAMTTSSYLREVRDRLQWEGGLRELKLRIATRIGSDGRTMILEAKGDSAQDAQTFAQTVIDVFLERQTASVEQRLDRAISDTDASLVGARAALEQARKAELEFERASGHADAVAERARLIKRANKLGAQAEEQAVEATAQRARIAELEAAKKQLPATIVSSAKKGTAVDAALARAKTDLVAARATLSEEHPKVKALRGRVASLEAQRKGQRSELSEETMAANPARQAVEQDLAKAKVALAGALEKRASLLELAATTLRKADALAVFEADAMRLQSDAKAAEQRVADLQKRLTSLRDAAQTPGSGFRVLAAPTLPEEAAGGGFGWLLGFASPLLGALIVALFFIARELDGLRVQTSTEVAWWGRGPVLGTSCWPRHADALDEFVDEMEDVGMIGAGRTLVVPATEAERELACAFALRLAEAPWLAAAILDVEARAGRVPIMIPATVVPEERLLPADVAAPRRPVRTTKPTKVGFAPPTPGAVPTPHPPEQPTGVRPPKGTIQGVGGPTETQEAPVSAPRSSRPPRKHTIVGIPASSHPPPAAPPSQTEAAPLSTRSSRPPPPGQPTPPYGTPLVEGIRRASVRMVVPEHRPAGAGIHSGKHPEVVLTRPVILAGSRKSRRKPMNGGTVNVRQEPSSEPVSASVMQAAISVLTDETHRVGGGAGTSPPADPPVALAWNGPLRGAVLRRAARLSHRVMVVVSAGMSAIDLSRVTTWLGRDESVGYVLVNLADEYADLADRVGPVEAFWEGAPPGKRD